MSETEGYTGTAYVVKPKENESLEQLCQRLCTENDINEKDSWNDTWEAQLQDDFPEKYVVVDSVVYDVSHKEDLDIDYLCEASKISDDKIKFSLIYYNGGTCFAEMFENAVKNISKESK